MSATQTARSHDTVTSVDGTTIAWHRSGEGPPAVLLHGTSSEKSGWAMSAPFLGAELELYAVDRRGRGGSGLGEPYDVDREVQDVAAVAAASVSPCT